jgi:hypothetical protein
LNNPPDQNRLSDNLEIKAMPRDKELIHLTTPVLMRKLELPLIRREVLHQRCLNLRYLLLNKPKGSLREGGVGRI